MAEHVSISTKFYDDPYVQSLAPTDKFLLKYLFDGPNVEPTLGIYELSLHSMAFHTGLDKDNIEHSLNRFAQAGKVHYVGGWVIVKNHFKHNPLNGGEKLIAGAIKRFDKVPWDIRDRVRKSGDTLYIPYLDPTNSLCIAPELFSALTPTLHGTNTPRGVSGPAGTPKTGGGEKVKDLEKDDATWL